MQRFKKNIICILICLLPFNISATINPVPFLKTNGDQFTLNGKPFVMKGFNYYPSHYGLSDMTTWDWNEVDKELALGESLGANTVRAFIDFGYSTGNPYYKKPIRYAYKTTPRYLAAINHFLLLADKHHLKVVFGLLGYMPGFFFVSSQPNYGTARNYVAYLLATFANDPRIAAWELVSEADLAPGKFGTDTKRITTLYNAVISTARANDKNHLITIGFADIHNAASVQNMVDFISFHYYSDSSLLTPEIETLKHDLHHPMPIVEAEFGSPSSGRSEDNMSRHLISLGANLDIALHEEHLAGALFWQLMDLGDVKTDLTRMQHKQGHLKFGVFDENYNAKPSATLVKNFFTWQYNQNNKISFHYTDLYRTSAGYRLLGIKLAGMQFLDKNKKLLKEIEFGTIAANLMEGQGWYANETGGQWLGNSNKIATLYTDIPTNTAYILLTGVKGAQGKNELQLWNNNKLIGSIVTHWRPMNYLFNYAP